MLYTNENGEKKNDSAAPSCTQAHRCRPQPARSAHGGLCPGMQYELSLQRASGKRIADRAQNAWQLRAGQAGEAPVTGRGDLGMDLGSHGAVRAGYSVVAAKRAATNWRAQAGRGAKASPEPDLAPSPGLPNQPADEVIRDWKNADEPAGP